MRTIKEIFEKYVSGELKPTELVGNLIDDAKKHNSQNHIFITITEERAMEEALKAEKEIASGEVKSPLHGIPYTLKDLFKTKGIKTTGGSKVLADYVPEEDAAVVNQLSDNGSVLLGKVNLHEFAHGAIGINPHYGTVPNPYDSTRIAGGSSSGSGGAVAAGYGFFSLGTDTGGSVRVPAALCGLVGLKPTYGLLSTEGVIPYCWSLDHVGIITQTAYDIKLVLSSLVQGIKIDGNKSQENKKQIVVGIPNTFFYDDLDPEIEEALEKVKKNIVAMGATLKSVEMPDLQNSRTASLVIQLPEVLSYHSKYLEEKGHLYSPDIFAGMTAGQFILAEQYLRAKRMLNYYREEMRKIFTEVDVLLIPSTPCVAPKIEDSFVELGGKQTPVGNAVTKFFSLFNMTGNPSITVPAGFHSTGLPMGFQLVGREFEDEFIVDLSIEYEKCFNVRA